jgi:predicted membrane metal-binding protein
MVVYKGFAGIVMHRMLKNRITVSIFCLVLLFHFVCEFVAVFQAAGML